VNSRVLVALQQGEVDGFFTMKNFVRAPRMISSGVVMPNLQNKPTATRRTAGARRAAGTQRTAARSRALARKL
jgi:hypothetical protein